jgi:hypothetical protein
MNSQSRKTEHFWQLTRRQAMIQKRSSVENRVAVIAALFLAGCAASPVSQSYRNISPPLHPYQGVAVLEQSQDVQQRVMRLIEWGYMVVGSSDYIGPCPTLTDIQAQAKKVGASRVVYGTTYMHTISGVSTFSVPNPPEVVQSSTSGNVGGIPVSGTTTTMVPGGSSTHSVPYVLDRFDVHVAFLWRFPGRP